MRARRRRVSTGSASEGSNSGQLLALALFIMLLAFFIVLNAISTFEEEKVRSTIGSIEGVFSSKMAPAIPGTTTSLTPSPLLGAREGSVLERLQGLFEAQIPGYDVQRSERNKMGEMHVRLPYGLFERAVLSLDKDDSELSEREKEFKSFFLPAMVSLLNIDEQGVRYRLDILVDVDEDPAVLANEQPQKILSVINKIALIARKLEGIGLDPSYLSVGLQKGRRDDIELFFRADGQSPQRPTGDVNTETRSVVVNEDEGEDKGPGNE